MFSTAQHVLQDELTSDEILLEALASKSRVRERLSRLIRQQTDLKDQQDLIDSLPALPGESEELTPSCSLQDIGSLN